MKKIYLLVILFITLKISVVNANLVLDDNRLDILIINSYGDGNVFEKKIVEGFKKSLESIENVYINNEYMDIQIQNTKEYAYSFIKYIEHKYKNHYMDVIVALDEAAYKLAKSKVNEKDSIFYNKPVFFAGVDNNDVIIEDNNQTFIGVINEISALDTINLILSVDENIDTINILLDDFSYSNEIKESIKNLNTIRPVKFNFIQKRYIEDVLDELKETNNSNQAIIISGYFQMKKDRSINTKTTIDLIKETTNIPIYTTNYSYVYDGVIGGRVEVAEKIGEHLAVELIKLLNNGKSKSKNLFYESINRYIFDYEQIYEYNIDVNKLPKDIILINKPKNELFIPIKLKMIFYLSILSLFGFIIFGVRYFIHLMKLKKNQKIMNKISEEREKLNINFIVDMNHELRTPLNVIFSSTKLIERKILVNDCDKEFFLKHLDKINNNTNRVLKLINDVIDITKFDLNTYNINLQNYNIVEVVEQVVEKTIKYTKEKNISMIFDTEEEEIITGLDKENFQKVILCLISNAIKYNVDNGNIEIYMTNFDKFVEITISDTGIGIDNKFTNNIFDRFYQIGKSLNKIEEGSGIGLYIAKNIINLHNGDIFVESEVDKGTTFKILMPIKIIQNNNENKTIYDVDQLIKLEMSDVNTR